jgi:hypothetical protein
VVAWYVTLNRRRKHEAASLVIGRAWRVILARKKLKKRQLQRRRVHEYMLYCGDRNLHHFKRDMFKQWLKTKLLRADMATHIQCWHRQIYSKTMLKRRKMIALQINRNEKIGLFNYKRSLLRMTFTVKK